MTHHGLLTRPRVAALVIAGTVAALASCKDSNIPFFTAPTSVAANPAGVQNAMSGLFAATRIDVNGFVITVAAGYARDGAVFTNTEPRTVEYPLGVIFTPNTSGGVWPQEYTNIRQAYQILAVLPNVSPKYSAAQISSLTGLVQTIIALNYMMVAEAHDTLGLAIEPPGTETSPPPAVCNPDAWTFITALLDTAEGNLEAAGAVAPPITLPKGFQGVGNASGPPTTLGSLASFNRALAAKANLEKAYAIARKKGGAAAPDTINAGTPDAPSLAAALADLDSSAMFDSTGAALAPNTAGGFSPNSYTVTHDYSAASGDIVNPIDGQIGTEAQLNDFITDVDTINDLRFKAKFIHNPNPVQQQLYNIVASKWLYYMSPSPGSTIPIIRDEGLTLIAAQIQLALGNLAKAAQFANLVRVNVGGLAAGAPALTYPAVRDFVMKEQRSSMTWEASADRTIAIRMYGLVLKADTTWEHEDPAVTTGDVHTTIEPIPSAELNGRGGTFTTTCSM